MATMPLRIRIGIFADKFVKTNTFHNPASWQKKELKSICVSREIESSGLTKARKNEKIWKFI
jgi:hypothetical protein